jgi:hypothetical protein
MAYKPVGALLRETYPGESAEDGAGRGARNKGAASDEPARVARRRPRRSAFPLHLLS